MMRVVIGINNRKLSCVGLAIVSLWGQFLFNAAIAENLIKNPGFEELNSYWADSSGNGASALINDSAYFHSGKYSGMTDATNGDSGFPLASLSQVLPETEISLLNQQNNLHWWYKISGREVEVGPAFFVRICAEDRTTPACDFLFYWYHAPNAELPWDTAYYKDSVLNILKFISAGSFNDTTDWKYEEKNFYDDWTGKGFPATAVLCEIALYSEGWIDPVGGVHYGQRVQWDDLWLGGPVGVREKISDHIDGFKIWPKLTKGIVNYVSKQPVSLYDSNGRLVESKGKGKGKFSITTNGIYFARSGDKTEKIILIK